MGARNHNPLKLKLITVVKGVGLIIVSLVMATSPLFTSHVLADEDYGIHLASSLKLGGQLGSNSCTIVDMSKNWAEILDSTNTSPYSYKSSATYFNNYSSRTDLDNFADDFHSRLSSGSGWAVAQLADNHTYSPTDSQYASYNKMIRIYLFNPSTTFTLTQLWGIWMFQSSASVKYIDMVLNPNASCNRQFYSDYYTGVIQTTDLINPRQQEFLFMATDNIIYPEGYAIDRIPDTLTDDDHDGLSAAKELTQGTSDAIQDTDGDGLSDYIESQWHPDREAIFCDTHTTPHTCAYPDPLKKDLYVQIDWLRNGFVSYKPTDTQLGLVAAKFADIGINFHADTGQYGGGNEIASSEQPTTMPNDFYHHKYGSSTESANFDLSRYKVWHYMVSGYNFDDGATDATLSSGKAEPGGDDLFLSYGRLQAHQAFYGYSNFADAVAGTIIHEIGHNLCLTSTPYIGQDSSCLFSTIDSFSASSNYHSAMNYNIQFTNNFSYSDGTNGMGDHNDLAAIMVGMNDFQNDNDSAVGGP